jgi:hypothetical protein
VPFLSDVRVFNTSYTDVLTVTAVYRFNGTTQTFDLAPREAKAFDDICVSLFGSPGSLGAVDFTTEASGELVVSSQLRSPLSGGGFVGMFIPGLPSSAAQAATVLTGLANGDSRTNIGVYNPNASGVTATIRLFDGPVLLGTTSVNLAGHAVTQVNNIYGVVGFGSLVRADGYATVESSDAGSPLFTYAAEADNRSGDLILIVGAQDVTAPAGFNPPTATPTATSAGPTTTPTQAQATPTPTLTAIGPTTTPTATPTPAPAIVVSLVATQFQWDFNGGGVNGGPTFQAKVGQTYQFQIRDGDPPGTNAHGFSGIASLGIPGLTLTAGGAAKTVTFTPNSSQTGNSFFSCDQPTCGTGHGNMVGTIQVVN